MRLPLDASADTFSPFPDSTLMFAALEASRIMRSAVAFFRVIFAALLASILTEPASALPKVADEALDA